jgi:hypothetical protein
MKTLALALVTLFVGCQPVSHVGTQGSGPDAQLTGTAGFVACGAAECDLGQGLVCCLGISSGDPVCEAPACPSFTSAIKCDGPEDCGGAPCCGNVGQGFSCSGAETCGSVAQLCHTDADCPAATPACCTVSYGAETFRACRSGPTGQCS